MKQLIALLWATSALSAVAGFGPPPAPHQHGTARLEVALEAGQLEARFYTPAMNLLGFEHPPETEAERARVKAVLQTLAQGYAMLRLPEQALCLLDAADVEQRLLPQGDAQHDDHHDHGAGEQHVAHDPADHSDHGGHADHGDHGDHEAPEGHADIRVSYRFVCAAPAALKALDVGLFDAFPGLETLRVELIGPGGQQLQLLHPANNRLSF